MLDQLGDAQHQLASGHAHGSGNAPAVVLLGSPRVDDDQILAGVDALLQLVGPDLWGLVGVKHLLAEDLALDIEALHHGAPPRAPTLKPTLEDARVRVTHGSQRRD